jgi:hypothetical protein
MNDSAIEKVKARRAVLILYGCMGLGVALPVLLYFLRS